MVGPLDDTPGEETPRERFRRYVKTITEVGQIRDCVEECLRTLGNQYNRALQDLMNHLGHLLQFEVTFGRYQGVQGQIGFDGHWKSPTGFHVVVETKTTEVYAIKTATLMNYIQELVSQRVIPNEDEVLGVYIVGRPDPEIRQLENAIVAEKKTQRLRIISANALLEVAEMMTTYDMGHKDVLALLRPSAPTIDPMIDLLSRLAGTTLPEPERGDEAPTPEAHQPQDPVYWLTPVKSTEDQTAEDCIKTLVGKAHIYAFGENTPGRKGIKEGDWIAFYATGRGVVAHAQVTSPPEKRPHEAVRDIARYPWVFKVADAKLYIDSPIVIDLALRSRLEKFQQRDLNESWAWFVQSTRIVSKADFELLTGSASPKPTV